MKTSRETEQTDDGKPAPMRSWRNRLLTLRRSKTEPPISKNLIVKRSHADDHTEKCVKRSVSMKTIREISKRVEKEEFDDKKFNENFDENENENENENEKSSPAYSKEELKLPTEFFERDHSGDTPRSGVRVSISNSSEKIETIEEETFSSGDEECTGEFEREPEKKKTGKPTTTKTITTYQDFVIRPLVVDDYGPMLLRFLSWFDPMKTKTLTHPKFAEVLLERKRKRHYTLIAVSSETGRLISLGSMIVVDNIFGPNFATGMVDSILIHPNYQGTMLFDKMLIRLKEVAEMIPDVKVVRINVEGKCGIEVIGKASSYKKLGRAYEMNL